MSKDVIKPAVQKPTGGSAVRGGTQTPTFRKPIPAPKPKPKTSDN